jgi:hypothetical protein
MFLGIELCRDWMNAPAEAVFDMMQTAAGLVGNSRLMLALGEGGTP